MGDALNQARRPGLRPHYTHYHPLCGFVVLSHF
jgi:hypothetical protein